MNHISSYPTVYALGHRAIRDIFSGPVIVQEKIDGSQFSFGRIAGEFVCRSKGKDIIPSAPEKMFIKAVATAQSMPLTEGWIYRAEYLQSPKHNSLAYDRVPCGNLMVFDIQTAPETYLPPEQCASECHRIRLEYVPMLHEGVVDSLEKMTELLKRTSILGGCKIEGFVVKNYAVFTQEKKAAIGKYVSEAFKEIHGVEWKKAHPTQTDVAHTLVAQFKTEARWRKAIQHLRDAGLIEGSPKDIGLLIKEIPDDILKECREEIRDRLFERFWPKIKRGVISGFPEFYKQELAQSAFQQRGN
jgi:hypothetical protein